jgi:hypothetical protein
MPGLVKQLTGANLYPVEGFEPVVCLHGLGLCRVANFRAHFLQHHASHESS